MRHGSDDSVKTVHEVEHPWAGRVVPDETLRVLVVDDSPDLADVLLDIVRSLGCQGRVACTGEEAMRVAADWSPSCCLVDIGLPDVHGGVLARSLRAASRRPIWVAAVSGYDLTGTHHAEAFDRLFLKPVRPAELAGALEALGATRP